MTLVQAIQLLKTCAPEAISTDELAQLKRVLDEQPSLPAAVGGRAWVENYLATAEAALAARQPTEQVPALVTEVLPADSQPYVPAARWPLRRVVECVIFAVLLLGAGCWVTTLLLHRSPTPPVSSPGSEQTNHPPRPSSQGKPEAKTAQQPASRPKPNELPRIAKRRSAPTPDLHPTSGHEPANTASHWSAWLHWHPEPAPGAKIESKSDWDLTDPSNPRPLVIPTTTGGVRLVYEGEIPPDTRLVMVNCRQVAPTARGTLSLWVDGKSVATQRITEADDARDMMLPLPGPAAQHQSLALVYAPGNPQEQVAWRRITISTARAEVMPAGAEADGGEPDASSPRLRVWLRADSGIRDGANKGATELGFDGRIQTWQDRSAAGRHFISDTGDPARRPGYRPNEPGLGGRAAVGFDGARQYLRYSVGSLIDSPAATLICVFQLTHLHRADRKRGCTVLSSTEPRLSLSFSNPAQIPGGHMVNLSSPAAISMAVDPRWDSRFVIAIMKLDGAASYLEINGVRTAGAAAGGKCGADFVLGFAAPPPAGSNGYPTGIAELMAYDRGLSDVETRQITQYLQRRYGIAAP